MNLLIGILLVYKSSITHSIQIILWSSFVKHIPNHRWFKYN